jgi:hypothetical protein
LAKGAGFSVGGKGMVIKRNQEHGTDQVGAEKKEKELSAISQHIPGSISHSVLLGRSG